MVNYACANAVYLHRQRHPRHSLLDVNLRRSHDTIHTQGFDSIRYEEYFDIARQNHYAQATKSIMAL